jgi:16S rRNA (cytosine967-C5)-methyltransferase
LAAQISYAVVFKKHNMSEVFIQRLSSNKFIDMVSSVKAICFDTVRYYLLLEDMWLQCVDKRPKDKLVRVIMTQAMAEFKYQNKPKHVVVNEAINVAKQLKKNWATGLINSCLRKAVELTNPKATSESATYAHPQWWIEQLKQDWPSHWQSMLKANNQKPPLWIRSSAKPDEILLPIPHPNILGAYTIQAQDITALESFKKGVFSVQDASAQMAAIIVNPQDNEKLLDACAAPGGKTGHLLELNKHIELDALELYPNRAKKIHDNLKRLKLTANVLVADSKNVIAWFNGNKYDKILLDAPCSASGIVRRHPDIKYSRKPEDLSVICRDQQALLSSVATVLKPGGKLLYATCSVFKQENSEQIKLFLKSHPYFHEIKLNYDFAQNCEYGIQIITGTQEMDGFYYCYLKKDED